MDGREVLHPDGLGLAVGVLTWPTGRAHASLWSWLAECGRLPSSDRIVAVCRAPHHAALNDLIARVLATGAEECLFAENDILCRTEDLAAFWAADADVVCARYGPDEWWAEPNTAFHLGLWRTRREVLEACGPPWAVEGEPGCFCQSLARRFRAAGLTVAGAVLHCDLALECAAGDATVKTVGPRGRSGRRRVFSAMERPLEGRVGLYRGVQ